MFGLFAGCLNSHLVRLGQCWETSFLFSCFKHVLGNLFAFILARLSFFLQSCVVHYYVIVVVLVFLDIW